MQTLEEKAASKKEYSKKWRDANPEKNRKSSKKWRENNLEKSRKSSKKWRENNLERKKIYEKEYYKKNIEVLTIKSKAMTEELTATNKVSKSIGTWSTNWSSEETILLYEGIMQKLKMKEISKKVSRSAFGCKSRILTLFGTGSLKKARIILIERKELENVKTI